MNIFDLLNNPQYEAEIDKVFKSFREERPDWTEREWQFFVHAFNKGYLAHANLKTKPE